MNRMRKVMENLTEGELKEVFDCGFFPRPSSCLAKWFSKTKVMDVVRKWDWYSNYLVVSRILWDKEQPWRRFDEVPREKMTFDLYKGRDLDDLLAYLFKASIDGYSIRYASTDTLTGLYLDRTGDMGRTNIDADVLDLLAKVVNGKWRGSNG